MIIAHFVIKMAQEKSCIKNGRNITISLNFRTSSQKYHSILKKETQALQKQGQRPTVRFSLLVHKGSKVSINPNILGKYINTMKNIYKYKF